jgi:hypothetical protein
MRTAEPRVWGEHLTATERMMVDDIITHLRSQSGMLCVVEVRRLRDGNYVLFDVGRRELSRLKRNVRV